MIHADVASLRPGLCVRHVATFLLRSTAVLSLSSAGFYCNGDGIGFRFEYLSNLANGSRCAQPIMQYYTGVVQMSCAVMYA